MYSFCQAVFHEQNKQLDLETQFVIKLDKTNILSLMKRVGGMPARPLPNLCRSPYKYFTNALTDGLKLNTNPQSHLSWFGQEQTHRIKQCDDHSQTTSNILLSCGGQMSSPWILPNGHNHPTQNGEDVCLSSICLCPSSVSSVCPSVAYPPIITEEFPKHMFHRGKNMVLPRRLRVRKHRQY